MSIDLNISEFIKPAFTNKAKFTIARSGRQSGKTMNAFIWLIGELFAKESLALWVDTTQSNLDKYVDIYVKDKILKDNFKLIKYDKQSHKLTFPNNSILIMSSAEKPENMEGLSYDYVVLNEAGIILKNDGAKSGLWDKSIKPMTKDAIVKIIGTPKGKGTKYHKLCQQAKNDPDWAEYHYTCYDSPYWTTEQLDKLKLSEPVHIWEQEYLAEFTDAYENAFIKSEWVKYYTHLPEIEKIILHADLSHTANVNSDYFCLCIVGKGIDNNFYVLDWVLEKIEQPEQINIIIQKYEQYKGRNVTSLTYDAISNDNFARFAQDEAIRRNISLPIKGIKVPTNKENNLLSVLLHFQAGRVYFNQDHQQIDEAMKQLMSFPNKNVHDDFTDALACCLKNIEQVVESITEENAENYPDYSIEHWLK